MITQLKHSTLFEDSAHMSKDCLLDDLKLLLICAGISMARKWENLVWARAGWTCHEFDSLYRKYSEVLKEIATDYRFELKYTHILCEYIGFMISTRIENGNLIFVVFCSSTYSHFRESLDFLNEVLDDNVHREFFKTLQPRTDFTGLHANAKNFYNIIHNSPVLKENLSSTINRLEDRIGETEFFKMAKKYAILCI